MTKVKSSQRLCLINCDTHLFHYQYHLLLISCYRCLSLSKQSISHTNNNKEFQPRLTKSASSWNVSWLRIREVTLCVTLGKALSCSFHMNSTRTVFSTSDSYHNDFLIPSSVLQAHNILGLQKYGLLKSWENRFLHGRKLQLVRLSFLLELLGLHYILLNIDEE